MTANEYDEYLEQALDEADVQAAETDIRFSAEEILARAKARIEQR